MERNRQFDLFKAFDQIDRSHEVNIIFKWTCFSFPRAQRALTYHNISSTLLPLPTYLPSAKSDIICMLNVMGIQRMFRMSDVSYSNDVSHWWFIFANKKKQQIFFQT